MAEYEQLFHHRRADLLAERRGPLVNDHPASVATTWFLSFERVKQKSPAAADLLRLCAFLAPDAIPETIIIQGAKYLGEHLALVGEDRYLLNQAIEVLRAHSLLSREVRPVASSLSVHRLVQAVLKDQMNEQEKHQWGERTIRAVEAALPAIDHQRWAQWEQILPQALQCKELIEQDSLLGVEVPGLLRQTGWYLTERIRYGEAEPLLKQALALSEQEQGLDHLDTAEASFILAYLHNAQGKYAEAEPLYVRALAICKQQLGPQHPSTQTVRTNYAFLLQAMGRNEEAR